jgi:type VI protein secretion system component VasA
LAQMIVQPDYLTDSPNPVISSGSLAMLAAIRRASSFVRTWPPIAAQAHSHNKHRQLLTVSVTHDETVLALVRADRGGGKRRGEDVASLTLMCLLTLAHQHRQPRQAI